MFLRGLNDEEKTAFMALAKHLVLTDAQVAVFEQEVIAGFMEEMHLSSEESSFGSSLSWEEGLRVFTNSSNVIKRTVIIELLAICYSNGDCDPQQVKIIEQIRRATGVPVDFVEKASCWVQQILKLTADGCRLVKGV